MFRDWHNFTSYTRKNILIWLTMAFQAGCINAGGFLTVHRFVTHVTGFATLVGIEVAHKNIIAAIGMASVPVFFLIGTMISAFYIDRRKEKGLRPRYSYAFFLMSFFLGLLVLLGVEGVLGQFGHELDTQTDYSLLALLCLTSGIQNATISSTFGTVVRTTHLTGPTTDLGISLVRIITNTHHDRPRFDEVLYALVRIGIISFFILGSIISSLLYFHYEYYGFYLPFAISFILWINSLRISFLHHRKTQS